MEEVKTDVPQTDAPSTAEQISVAAQEIANPGTTELSEPSSLSEPGNAPVDEAPVDRSWENVAREAQRKNEKLSEEMQEMKGMLSNIQENVQKPTQEYTVEQLRELKRTNPEYEVWCDGEIDRMNREATVREVKGVFEQEQAQKQAMLQRQQVFQQVATTFTDAFVKDANGNSTGEWDMSSPLTKRIDMYMRDPRVAQSPEGLLAAAKMAYADVQMMDARKLNAKVALTQAEVKDLQRSTLVEGGGHSAGAIPPRLEAIAQVNKTGKPDDVAKAMGEIFKARGVLK